MTGCARVKGGAGVGSGCKKAGLGGGRGSAALGRESLASWTLAACSERSAAERAACGCVWRRRGWEAARDRPASAELDLLRAHYSPLQAHNRLGPLGC